MTGILLADDHAMVREGLRKMLEESGLQVVGEVTTGRQVLKAVKALRPDVVLMDITLPELNGIEATVQLKKEIPDIKIIGVSMHSDRSFVAGMLKAGAMGYVLKTSPFDELLNGIKAVLKGQHYLSPSIASIVVAELLNGPGHDLDDSPYHLLTGREREVLQLLAEGKSSKEIADCLNIGVSTVDTYRCTLKTKLQVDGLAGLIKYSLRHGLSSLDP